MLDVKFLIVMASVIFFSCEDASKKEIQTIHDTVMEVHDGVMTRMGEMHTLKKNLSASLSPAQDSALVIDAIKKLDEADEVMMVWMEEFNAEYTTLKSDEQKQYLNMELEKIKTVKTVMLVAIENANQLLKKGTQNNAK
jgi:hypothetical protein